jgi:hypothetical protein
VSDVALRGSSAIVPTSMNDAMRLADMMSRGRLMPKHLLDSPGDCLMVVEQAMRWNMSPFAVAQATSVIQGKLMFEGKLVAAAVEASGAIDGLLDYTFEGEGDSRAVIVSATRHGEKEPRTVRVALKDAITTNGIWKKQPDQQLVYHGARVWARRWTPGVTLGVYSPEEMTDPRHDGPTIEARAEVIPDLPPDAAPVPAPVAPDPLSSLRAKLAQCATLDDVERVRAMWNATITKAEAAGRPIGDMQREAAKSLIEQRIEALDVIPEMMET